ncbi:MAG: hypothetical protein QNJ84_13030 [Alphaproteobacteria bacterium]|nr:hypothetical protein [Alphaproteobacteria bacterium]
MTAPPANENDTPAAADAGDGGDDASGLERAAPADPALRDSSAALSARRKDLIVDLMRTVNKASADGLEPRAANETLLALSISVFVGTLGREGAALLIERLPDKIRKGDFGDGGDLEPPRSPSA